MHEFFRRLAAKTARYAGNVWAFVIAVLVILTWLVTGPLFEFSNTWQLVINTLTTITTFLMVFLIQNTQNRDNKAMHLKLDELIKAVRGADLKIVDVNDISDKELEAMEAEFKILQQKYLQRVAARKTHDRTS